MKKIAIILLALCLAPTAAAGAQALAGNPSPAAASGAAYFPIPAAHFTRADETATAAALPFPKYGGWVGITKWATLGAAAGFGIYGFKLNGDADDIFSRLETLCQADPDNCRSRNPDGSYTDPVLESLYQDALSKDNSARTLLITSQVFFGVSVVLFIVDFQKDDGPGNVPYEPDEEQSPLEFVALPGTIAVRYYLR